MKQQTKQTMEVVCAWCQLPMGTKPSNRPGVTHGICKPCVKDFMKDMEKFEWNKNFERSVENSTA